MLHKAKVHVSNQIHTKYFKHQFRFLSKSEKLLESKNTQGPIDHEVLSTES